MSNKTASNYRQPHVFDPIHNGADECECGLLAGATIHESDDAYEERMRPRIVNAPDRVWLQVGCDDEVGEIDWKELSHPDVSWCAEKIDNTDIEYVRADLLTTARKEEREAAFKEAVNVTADQMITAEVELNESDSAYNKAIADVVTALEAAATTEKQQ